MFGTFQTVRNLAPIISVYLFTCAASSLNCSVLPITLAISCAHHPPEPSLSQASFLKRRLTHHLCMAFPPYSYLPSSDAHVPVSKSLCEDEKKHEDGKMSEILDILSFKCQLHM